MSDQKEFPGGIYAKAPNEKAPDFVKGAINIKRDDAIAWLESKGDEWVSLQMKESKAGKWYLEVDNWKPESQEKVKPQDFEDESIPF